MTGKADKVAYVLRQGQQRDHTCHWPGCGKQVPPARWGCKAHWFALPKHIRDAIWQTFRPGQERTMTPSAGYVAAAREAQAWIAKHRKDSAERAAAASTQEKLL